MNPLPYNRFVLIRTVLGAGLLLIPLVWSFGNENTALVKSLLTAVAAAGVIAAAGPGPLWTAIRPAWPAHVLAVAAVVLAAFSPSPSFARPVALLVITLWVILAAAASVRAGRWWTTALCLTALPPVLLGALQAAGLDPSPWQPIALDHFHGRICSTLGNPNFYAAWLCGILPFTAIAVLGARSRVTGVAAIALAAFAFAALLLTGSKGGLVGLGATAAAGWLAARRAGLDPRPAFRSLGTAGWAIPVVAVVFTGFTMPADVRDRMLLRSPAPAAAVTGETAPGASGGLARNESVKFRLLTWAQTGRMLRDQPVLGLGPGRYQVAYPAYRNPEIIRMFGQHSYMTDHPENLTLEIAAELGVPGLGLWIWLWWLAAARLWRRARDGGADERPVAAAALAGLAGLLATNSVGVDVHYGATAFLGAVLTGIAFQTRSDRKPSDSDASSSPYRLFSWSVSVLLMLVWSRLYASDAALARALAASTGSSWDQAHVWYDRALTLNRGNVMARYFAASALLDSRGPEALPRAEALLDSVRAEAPVYVLLNYKYWLLYNRAGRRADARAALARQIALDPHAATFHLERGRFAMAEQRWEDAERDFEAAADAEPGNPAGWQYLGNLRVERGRYRDALAAYDRGLMRHPGSVELHFNAAVAALKLKDRRLARAHAEAVLAVDPNHAQARLVLMRLP